MDGPHEHQSLATIAIALSMLYFGKTLPTTRCEAFESRAICDGALGATGRQLLGWARFCFANSSSVVAPLAHVSMLREISLDP